MQRKEKTLEIFVEECPLGLPGSPISFLPGLLTTLLPGSPTTSLSVFQKAFPHHPVQGYKKMWEIVRIG